MIAHEIHHIFFGSLIPEEMKPEEYFLLNFAFEGLAVHFMNNQAAMFKSEKYPGGSYCMAREDMVLYESEFDELFAMLQDDLQKAGSMTMDQVTELVSRHYEQITYTSLKTGKSYKISQYPTYYLGCYLFGLIDSVLGKGALYEALEKPDTLIGTYNRAAQKAGHPEYLLTM